MGDRLVVTIDEKEHGLDLDTVTALEWKEIHRYTGLTPFRFLAAMSAPADALPDAIEALRWLVLSRAGEQIELGGAESGDFALFEFLGSLRQAPDRAEESPAPKARGSRRS